MPSVGTVAYGRAADRRLGESVVRSDWSYSLRPSAGLSRMAAQQALRSVRLRGRMVPFPPPLLACAGSVAYGRAASSQLGRV